MSNIVLVCTAGPGAVVPQQVYRFVNYGQNNSTGNVQQNQWFLRPIMPVMVRLITPACALTVSDTAMVQILTVFLPHTMLVIECLFTSCFHTLPWCSYNFYCTLCQSQYVSSHLLSLSYTAIVQLHSVLHTMSVIVCFFTLALTLIHCHCAVTVFTAHYVSHRMFLHFCSHLHTPPWCSYTYCFYSTLCQSQYVSSLLLSLSYTAIVQLHSVFTAHYVSHRMFLHSCSHSHTPPWCSYTYSFYCTVCQSQYFSSLSVLVSHVPVTQVHTLCRSQYFCRCEHSCCITVNSCCSDIVTLIVFIVHYVSHSTLLHSHIYPQSHTLVKLRVFLAHCVSHGTSLHSHTSH